MLCYRHYIYEQKLSSLLWKIDYRDLLVTDPDVDPALTGKAKVEKNTILSCKILVSLLYRF